MKITGKTLQVSLEHNVTVGNGAIEATIHHMAWISENSKDQICVDLDFCDITNVKFMGMPIEDGCKGYEKFKKSMSELGINVTKMFDEEASKLITDDDMFELKRMYRR
jgi:hypothetical protein